MRPREGAVYRDATTPGSKIAPVSARRETREMLADYLKLLAWWMGRPPAPTLPPRLDQTLHGLLRGRSEKEIARDLRVSLHTAHGYVKESHRRLGVASRGELMVRFLPSRPPVCDAR